MSICRGDYKQFEEHAEARGWTVTKTKKNHIQFRAPTGAVVFIPSTPSDGKHGFQNARAQLRRAGLDV